MKNIFSRKFWSERDMELHIGQLLRFGVMLACGITLAGGVLYFIQQGGQMPDYSPVPDGEAFAGVDISLRYFSSIIDGVIHLRGAAIIQLGVCVLIATPVLRVAVSAIAFLIERDYMYVAITLIVLGIILGNMIIN